MNHHISILLWTVVFFMAVKTGYSVKCFQCSSEEDPEGKDLCGAYESFREEEHVPVDCLQDESVTPGTFCVKITKQSPRSFIWDGRWRYVIRRCASVTETGVTNVCNWGVDLSGVYYEECYCTSDSCNHAGHQTQTSHFLTASSLALLAIVATCL